ncbi:MAG TPA: DUF3999 family protein [Pirellulales bacterium]|jgi:hypothetical protein|nr:DUF3999 family protein [Pirellulales bacterium]
MVTAKRALLILASLLVASRAAVAELSPLRYWKAIDRASPTADEIVAFRIDTDIYAQTRDCLPDLRVIDDADVETPYQVEPASEYQPETTRLTFALDLVTLTVDGGSIELHVRRPENSPKGAIDGVTLVTQQKNFERLVDVDESVDGEQWALLVRGALIFDYAQFMDVSNREIKLPSTNAQHLKITIHDAIGEKELVFKELRRTFREGAEIERAEKKTVVRDPIRIDKIQAWHDETKPKVRQALDQTYTLTGFTTTQIPDKKQTVVTIPTERQPLTSLAIESSSRNYSRRVSVEAPTAHHGSSRWQAVGEARISSFDFRDYHHAQDTIRFGQRRAESYHLVIDNQDNPPLAITKIRGEGPALQVVFLAQPERRYRVYYGSDDAEPARYETATVLAALRDENFHPVDVHLGPQQDNTAYIVEMNRLAGHLLDNWWFLGSVIVVMVAALGWSLLRAGRKVGNLTDDSQSP